MSQGLGSTPSGGYCGDFGSAWTYSSGAKTEQFMCTKPPGCVLEKGCVVTFLDLDLVEYWIDLCPVFWMPVFPCWICHSVAGRIV